MLSPTFRYSNTAFGAKRSLGDNQAKRQVKMTTIMPEITPHRLPNHRNEISFTRDDETAQVNATKSSPNLQSLGKQLSTRAITPPTQKSLEEAYRRREYLDTCLLRRTVPSIQSLREDKGRDLQLRVSNSLGGMERSLTNRPVI